MRTEVRVVSGILRGRKIEFEINPLMRPTPQRVREALFSILGVSLNGIAFFDVFAGTGVNGFEAISRGASKTTFIERDFHLAQAIERYIKKFNVGHLGHVICTDAYRWAARWIPIKESSIIFISPPFIDFKNQLDELFSMVRSFQEKVKPGSVVVVQTESEIPIGDLPDAEGSGWDKRVYGRNELQFWVKNDPNATPEDPEPMNDESES
ncbi:MAG: hypothetical protein RL179_2734 [Planctomycetota bacterium]